MFESSLHHFAAHLCLLYLLCPQRPQCSRTLALAAYRVQRHRFDHSRKIDVGWVNTKLGVVLVLDVEHSLACLGDLLIFLTFSLLVAFFIDCELNVAKNVRYHVDGILESDRHTLTMRYFGHEFHVVGVCGSRVVEAVLIAVLNNYR
jgi:hypothetical protein